MSSTQIAGFATDRPDNRIHSESESAKPVEDFSRVERAARRAGGADRGFPLVSRSPAGSGWPLLVVVTGAGAGRGGCTPVELRVLERR